MTTGKSGYFVIDDDDHGHAPPRGAHVRDGRVIVAEFLSTGRPDEYVHATVKETCIVSRSEMERLLTEYAQNSRYRVSRYPFPLGHEPTWTMQDAEQSSE